MNSFQTGTLCTSQLINHALFLYQAVHSQGWALAISAVCPFNLLPTAGIEKLQLCD